LSAGQFSGFAPQRRRYDAALRVVDERVLQIVPQLPDAGAQYRLGDVAGLRGAPEMAVIR